MNARKTFVDNEMPREKLIKYGLKNLSNVELLAIILSTGGKGNGVKKIAEEVLEKLGPLNRLYRKSVGEISEIKGVGIAKACRILSAFELGLRLKAVEYLTEPLVNSSLVFKCYQHLSLNERETFYALSLNAKNRVIREWKFCEGSSNACILSPREIFSNLLKEGCMQVIFLHNHPSGDPTASNEDIHFTKRLVEAGNFVGIKVLDHIIIGNENYVSLRDEGII